MAYSKEVLHRAEARLEQARRQNELDCEPADFRDL